MKGCLSLVFKIIIVILAYIGFQSLGGVDFVKEKFNEYTVPTQETLIEQTKSIANFSNINKEYILDRNVKLFKYQAVLAEHKASGQKIAIIDPKDNELISKKDFKTGEIDKKLKDLNDKFQYQLVRFENFEITKKGTMHAFNQKVPYVRFEADTVNLPIGHVAGIIGIAENKNGDNVILASMNGDDKYSQIITEGFFKNVK